MLFKQNGKQKHIQPFFIPLEDKIIFTLYLHEYADLIVIEFARNFPLFGVTMPIKKATEGKLPLELSKIGVASYVHTVNSAEQVKNLKERKVSGVYTDFLRSTEKISISGNNELSVEKK